LKPVQNEQHALDVPQIAQGQGQAILASIALHYMMYVIMQRSVLISDCLRVVGPELAQC
jgi:hypothetical protein